MIRDHKLFPSLLSLALLFAPTGMVSAQGVAFTYQGRLTENNAPFNGSAEFQPTLWTERNAGSQVAANTPATFIVGVTNGLFVLPLDFGAAPFETGAERWLQLEVRTAIGPFSLLGPRQKITATPYALTASRLTGTLPASQLSGAIPSANLSGAYSGAVTFNNAANAFTGSGSGLTELNASQLTTGTVPDARIPATITRDSEVMSLVLAADGPGSGLDADLLDGIDSTAFVRTNGPTTIGGSNNAAAILTVNQAGAYHGILANTASTDAGEAAVTGRAGATGPTINSVAGVFGTSVGGRGVIGSSSTNDGVLGYSSSGRGVYGQSRAGNGVEGLSLATSGAYYGVRGENQSTNSGAGVLGESAWVGVWGESSGRWGVYGRANGSANSYGIYGAVSAGTGNYAGYFVGNVNVTGTLSKGGGSFKIDHPLDPANKYLSHSFVESPDMMNIYNGNVALDETGAAQVTLPAYFEALNRDFRYQLTPVGGAAPNLHVAEAVRNNAFRIAGGTPGLQVSWQVTGIRQDAFANANRIVVEEDKPTDQRGTYLHAKALGQPAEKSSDSTNCTDPSVSTPQQALASP